MSWRVRPAPASEEQRAALLSAVERALGEAEPAATGQATRWWDSGLDDLDGGPVVKQSWRQRGASDPESAA